MQYIKITKLARDLNITPLTLYNWKKRGLITFVKLAGGRYNYVTREEYDRILGIKETKNEKTVIYARVSSTVNKTNLDTQVKRLIDYCNAKGYKVDKVIKEFGSGINDQRPLLKKLLTDLDFTRLVVEHKDRLTRVGFEYIKTFLNKLTIELEVINNFDTDEEDLVQDFVSIITSYCARIYGRRRSRRKTEELILTLKEDYGTN